MINKTCGSNEQNCFFYFTNRTGEPELILKKILIFMRNVIDTTQDTYSMIQENYKIFSDFYFYENKSKIYFSYKCTSLTDFTEKIPPNN